MLCTYIEPLPTEGSYNSSVLGFAAAPDSTPTSCVHVPKSHWKHAIHFWFLLHLCYFVFMFHVTRRALIRVFWLVLHVSRLSYCLSLSNRYVPYVSHSSNTDLFCFYFFFFAVKYLSKNTAGRQAQIYYHHSFYSIIAITNVT